MAEQNDNAQIAKEILAFLIGAGMNATPASRAAGILGSVSGASRSAPSIPGISDAATQFMAKQYPTEFAPDAWHNYDVDYIPGKANENSSGKANMPIIDEAGVMQDIDLHNRTITKHIHPGMTPKQQRLALNQGLEEEKRLPQFWNESASRLPFSVSSSAVTGIRLTPDARIEVQWKNKPTWYTFKAYPNTYEASRAAQELLKADSIGRAVYPVKSRGPGSPYMSRGGKLLGAWNYKNYDGSMAH